MKLLPLFIAAVSWWAAIYAVVVAQWREAFILVCVFIANVLLTGSKKG